LVTAATAAGQSERGRIQHAPRVDAPMPGAGDRWLSAPWPFTSCAPSPRLYLFDIDGTLLATQAAATNRTHKDAFGHAIGEVFNIPNVRVEDVDHSGKTDVWILRLLLEHHGVPAAAATPAALAAAQRAMEAYCAARGAEVAASVAVLPGAAALLARLRATGACLGLVTGNPEAIAEMKVRAAGLAHFFSVGAFGSDAEDRAVLVERARAAAQALGVGGGAPPATWHTGDTPMDVDAAARAGARSVAVATGHYTLDALRLLPGTHAAVPDLCDAAEMARVFGLREGE
jgi:phosphoglycolate phosphatase-like HAD superfamily hydrolase